MKCYACLKRRANLRGDPALCYWCVKLWERVPYMLIHDWARGKRFMVLVQRILDRVDNAV